MDFRKQLAKESRFSRAAGPCDNHRGEMSRRLSDHIVQISRYVSHVSILRWNLRIINNEAFDFVPRPCISLLPERARMMNQSNLEDLLRSALEECERLRAENAHLRMMLRIPNCMVTRVIRRNITDQLLQALADTPLMPINGASGRWESNCIPSF